MDKIRINKIIGEGFGSDKNILLTFNENYLYQTGNLILTLNKHNEGLFFYLFCDNITKQMEEYLFSICKNIKMYEFTINLGIDTKRWPNLSLLRLFAPFLISDNIKQLLYLDSDILCKGNIDELFAPLGNQYDIAMAPDFIGINIFNHSKVFYNSYPIDLYCNSGMEIINVKTYRNNYSFEYIYECLYNLKDKLDFPDQDFLNYFFYGKIRILNRVYNYVPNDYRGTRFFKQSLAKAKLIHFTTKPWNWKNPWFVKKLYMDLSIDKTMVKIVKKARIKGFFLRPLRKLLNIFISK